MFVKEILFITVGVFGLQFLHEIGHFVMARFKNVKIGFPIPIPSLQIGTFGSITPLRSFPKNREDLFDVASSGPIVTFVASSILYAFGLSLTVNAPLDILNLYPAVPAANGYTTRNDKDKVNAEKQDLFYTGTQTGLTRVIE